MMTREVNLGRIASISTLGGLSCALVLSLILAGDCLAEWHSTTTAISAIVVILSGVRSFASRMNECSRRTYAVACSPRKRQGIFTKKRNSFVRIP